MHIFANLFKLKSKRIIAVAALVATAFAMLFLIVKQWQNEYLRHELIAVKHVESVALSLGGIELQQLSASAQDEGTPAYTSIKLRLKEHKAQNLNIAYIYVFKIIGDTMVFMVDAEENSSPNYSAPGTEYNEVLPETLQSYQQNSSVFEHEYSDSFGTWVSVTAQINNLQNGQTLAYLGVDYYASSFYNNANHFGAQYALLILAVYLLVISTALAIKNNFRLRKQQTEYNQLINQTPLGIALHEIICDQSGKPIDYKFLAVNKSFETMLGVKAQDILGKSVLQLFPKTEPYWIDTYGKVALTQIPVTYYDYSEHFKRDFKVVAYSPKKNQFAVLIEDITDAKETQQKLLSTAKEYEAMASSLLVGLLVINNEGNIEYVNKKACDILGVSQQQLISQYSTKRLWHLVNSEGRALKKEEYPFNIVLKTQKAVENLVAGVQLKGKDIVWVSINAVPFSVQDGIVEKMIINISDITQERIKQKEIEYLSMHDSLTGLYNRRFFEAMLTKLDRPKHYPITIAFMDVNNLKIFNDAYGHDVGDQAISILADALKKAMNDKDIVCRTGGDEFSVIMPSCSNAQAEQRINALHQTLTQYHLHSIAISASVGFETKTNKDIDIKEVQRKAEKMMYQRKVSMSLRVRSQAIQSIFKSLTEKTDYEKQHSHNVAQLASIMGKCLGLSGYEIQQLEMAGMYHDIGKISIPAYILFKPGILTESEYEIIKTHPEVGYQILRAADEFSGIAEYVLYHHEWWNGQGYTKGLKGEQIPYFSRIISICDAYEAMVTNRPYRKGIGREKAVAELQSNSGTQFDPNLIKVFIEKVLPQTSI